MTVAASTRVIGWFVSSETALGQTALNLNPTAMPATKIMIADDSLTIRVKLKQLFLNSGYEVIEAKDGNDAVAQLCHQPDLLVLDVNMPNLDGYGVCEKIREQDSADKNLPIVFLTSLETKAMELLGNEYGAYLSKPVDDSELLTTVEGLLEKTNPKTSVV
jgi:DNA-binding response OmpR family regulator